MRAFLLALFSACAFLSCFASSASSSDEIVINALVDSSSESESESSVEEYRRFSMISKGGPFMMVKRNKDRHCPMFSTISTGLLVMVNAIMTFLCGNCATMSECKFDIPVLVVNGILLVAVLIGLGIEWKQVVSAIMEKSSRHNYALFLFAFKALISIGLPLFASMADLLHAPFAVSGVLVVLCVMAIGFVSPVISNLLFQLYNEPRYDLQMALIRGDENEISRQLQRTHLDPEDYARWLFDAAMIQSPADLNHVISALKDAPEIILTTELMTTLDKALDLSAGEVRKQLILLVAKHFYELDVDDFDVVSPKMALLGVLEAIKIQKVSRLLSFNQILDADIQTQIIKAFLSHKGL